MPTSQPLVILIVDEQQVVIDLLAEKITTPTVRVVGVTSVEEAKRRLATDKFDVFVLDADLPDATHLVQFSRSSYLPCIALTHSDYIHSQLEALGVKVVLSKDAHLEIILDAMRRYVHASPVRETQILAVDAHDLYRRALRIWLKKHGYTVLTAGTGQEAVKVMQENPSIDLALLEIRLPDMGGMEVLTEISKWVHRPQVIMVTTVEDGVIADQARQLGAFDYLVKPVKINVLEQSIVACLAHAEYQRQGWLQRLLRRA